MPAPRPRTLRRVALAGLAAALAASLVLAFRPEPPAVEVAAVARGPIRVTVDGTGRTHVRDVYAVLAPASGHLERVALREGASVEPGQWVATLAAAASAPLDPRTRAELAGRLAAARAARAEATGALARSRVAAEQAERDRARATALAGGGAAAASDAEAAAAAARLRAEDVRMGEAARRRAAGEEEAARAALEGASARSGDRLVLRAPAGGRVLRVLRESEGPIAAGEPVLNRDLIEAADARARSLKVRFSWVRGHDGHPVNEIVDALAQAAARGTPGPGEAEVLGALRAARAIRPAGEA